MLTWGRHSCLPVGATFQSPPGPDWKLRRTGRLEGLPLEIGRFRSGKATPGARTARPQSWPKATAAAFRCFGGGRDARAPRVAASNTRFVSSQYVPPTKPVPGSEATFGLRRQAKRDAALDWIVKPGNLIQSVWWRTSQKRPRRSALPAQSKESPDCGSKTSNLQFGRLESLPHTFARQIFRPCRRYPQ